MEKRFFTFVIILCSITLSTAQSTTPFFKKSDTLNIKRRNTVVISQSILAVSALTALDQLWYADYPRSSFHLKNDNNDWLQMDKFGHFTTAYYLGKVGMNTYAWAGMNKKSQLLYGATSGLVFLTAIEILDGLSQQWGASIGDAAANMAGTLFLIGQELLWKEQRIGIKFSFHRTKFATIRPEIFGENTLQESLKDYNGQTYWLSANVNSFIKKEGFPNWLNIAFGIGAEEMLYGDIDTPNSFGFKPYRQFYLSIDVDLSKINTSSKFLKTIFNTINFIKIPLPTLEYNSRNGFKAHIFYF